ncbi:MAG: isoprenylcysteine carboxylmethyltransferase family protein [Asgard group archaeon]|nr:isoprenylcysteine carboxylmethyltransferase family protein [Asgard group archaeon]
MSKIFGFMQITTNFLLLLIITNLSKMIEYINLSILIISILLFSILYTLSTLPKTLSEKMGEKAWQRCKTYRFVAIIFEMISLVNLILWVWDPMKIEVVNWKISSKWWVGVIIGGIVAVIGTILMVKGMLDAGSETHTPTEETKLYGGIYNKIRHPQTLGEMPLFPAIAFIVNSWFLVILMLVYILIYTPIMIYFEEKDLVKRFGDEYQQYQKEVGILLPKLKHRRKEEEKG